MNISSKTMLEDKKQEEISIEHAYFRCVMWCDEILEFA